MTEEENEKDPCPECDGTGTIDVTCRCARPGMGGFECGRCGNSGVSDSYECSACDGTGEIEPEDP